MAARKGDSVLVIKDENADWLKVRVEQSGEEGYVPRSFVAPLLGVEVKHGPQRRRLG